MILSTSHQNFYLVCALCCFGRPSQRHLTSLVSGLTSAWIVAKPTEFFWRQAPPNVLIPTTGMMQGDALGLASPRQVHRALDNVPTRNARAPDRRSPVRVGCSTLGDGPDGPASYERDNSCSPTPSEFDALEESFFDLGLEPSQVTGDSSQSSYSDMQTNTTVTSLSSKTTSAFSGHLDLLQPLSGLAGGPRCSEVVPLGDRLSLVWRMSPTTSLSRNVLF